MIVTLLIIIGFLAGTVLLGAWLTKVERENAMHVVLTHHHLSFQDRAQLIARIQSRPPPRSRVGTPILRLLRRLMLPTNFPESNAVLGPPQGMSEEECSSLFTLRSKDESGHPVVVSCWKPTRDELEALNAGRPLWLVVLGQTMPPVYLTTDRPF